MTAHMRKLEKAYRATHHEDARQPVKWFRARLEAAGIAIGRTSLYRYLNGDREMPDEVKEVLDECQREAVATLNAKLEGLR